MSTVQPGPDHDGRRAVEVRRLSAVVARGLGIPHGDSLLVRPDGVPARTASPAALAGLGSDPS